MGLKEGGNERKEGGGKREKGRRREKRAGEGEIRKKGVRSGGRSGRGGDMKRTSEEGTRREGERKRRGEEGSGRRGEGVLQKITLELEVWSYQPSRYYYMKIFQWYFDDFKSYTSTQSN